MNISPEEFVFFISKWAVIGWMSAHTVAWVAVEMMRLWVSTRIKLSRILSAKEPEE